MTIVVMFIGVCIASAGEIPKAVWKPGYFNYPSTLRLDEDGRYATMLSQSGITVVDLRTGLCAFTQPFIFRKPPFGYDEDGIECTAAVSTTGNEFCVLSLLEDRLSWYHVGDTIPWHVQPIEDYDIANIQFVADTVLVLTTIGDSSGAKNLRISPSAETLTAIKHDARHTRWLNDSTVAIDGSASGLPIAIIVNAHSGDTVLTFPGYCLGIDSGGRLLVFHHMDQFDIVALDPASGSVLEVIVDSTGQNAALLRSIYVETHAGLMDIRTRRLVKELHPYSRPYDVLSDGTHLYIPPVSAEMHIWWRDTELQKVELFSGPVTCVVQDPRDSVIYALTHEANSHPNQGPGRHIVRIDGEVAVGYNQIGSQRTISNSISVLAPFRQINDVWVSEFRGGEHEHFQGYIEFAPPDADTVGIQTCIQYYDDPPFYSGNRRFYFSERGDTLMVDDAEIQSGTCKRPRKRDPAEDGLSGFLPTTNYYVVRNVRYTLNNCADSMLMPYDVKLISMNTDLLFAYDEGKILLTSGSEIGRHLASVNLSSYKEAWWADSGTTIRVSTGNRTTVVSLHSDGHVSICALPETFSRRAAQWFPSHDGRVLTCRTGDTVVTIDLLTAQILREYNGASWLYRSYPFEVNPFGKNCQVSDVDGRLIVSLSNGCVATFPGVTLPVTSHVDEHLSPLRPLPSLGTRIEGATPQSIVTVYSVLGTTVLQCQTDDNGSVDIADKGLPHGAYVVVYASGTGFASTRVIR